MPPTAAALHVTITHPQSHAGSMAPCSVLSRTSSLSLSLADMTLSGDPRFPQTPTSTGSRHPSSRDSLKLRQALVHDIPPPGANNRGKKVSTHQCLTSTETIRLIRDGENGGGGGGGGMEVGKAWYYMPIATLPTRMIPALRWASIRAIFYVFTWYYMPIATLPTRMIPALRWASMRAIFNVPLIVRDKLGHRLTVSTLRPQRLKIGKESRNGFEPGFLCSPA